MHSEQANQKQGGPQTINAKDQVKGHLRTTYLLEDEQIDHMLATAAVTLAKNLSNAETALKNSDYKELSDAAHSLKGSLLNLGLDDFARTAKEIEINAKENKKIDYQELLSGLHKGLAELLH
jgi:HPt (histidine-containing phosphotransfer) domain-containing protein